MVVNRTARRDAAIRAVLPLVPDQGWSLVTMRRVYGDEAEILFPNGSADLVDAYIDLADRDMVASAAPILVDQRLSQRVRTLIAMRLDQALPHKQAIRRAMSVLALPTNAALAARCTARTVDAIWCAAGDTGKGVSWYTKRVILAGVYGSTLLYWLDGSHNRSDTLAFLDRRLAGVARLGKLRGRLVARLRM